MALAKMQALADFLRSKNLFAPEQFDYWMENGTAEYASKQHGNGLVLCRFQYDAVFSVERFADSADLFLVFICVWLMDNDCNRDALDLAMPEVDVSPLDDHTVDVEVKITFSEDITVVQDDAGPVEYSTRRWRIAEAVVSDVNKVGVGDDQQRPTDLPYERD